jgi:hypothetical protein
MQIMTPIKAPAAAMAPTAMPIFVAVESEPSAGAAAAPPEVVAAGAAAVVEELVEDAVLVADDVEDYPTVLAPEISDLQIWEPTEVVVDVSFAASDAVVEELLLELDVVAGGASVVVGVVGAGVDGAGGVDVTEVAGGAMAAIHGVSVTNIHQAFCRRHRAKGYSPAQALFTAAMTVLE